MVAVMAQNMMMLIAMAMQVVIVMLLFVMLVVLLVLLLVLFLLLTTRILPSITVTPQTNTSAVSRATDYDRVVSRNLICLKIQVPPHSRQRTDGC